MRDRGDNPFSTEVSKGRTGSLNRMLKKFEDLLRRPGLHRFLNRSRIFIGAGFFFFWWYHVDPSRASFWVSLLVAFSGELVQIWSASCLDKNRTFAPRGPYALVRNPMYVGRFFVIGGVLLLDPRAWLLLLFGIVYYLYLRVRVEGEERRLKELFGAPYEKYLETVPRYFPTPWHFCRDYGPLLFFRWSLVFQNREHRNFLGLCIFYLVTYWYLNLPGPV